MARYERGGAEEEAWLGIENILRLNIENVRIQASWHPFAQISVAKIEEKTQKCVAASIGAAEAGRNKIKIIKSDGIGRLIDMFPSGGAG